MTTPAVKIAALAGITRSANDNFGIGVDQPGNKLTIAGMIHTTSGGIKFPDGTIQTTAGAGADVASDITKLKTDYTTLDGKVNTKASYSDVTTAISNANGSTVSRVTTLETNYATLDGKVNTKASVSDVTTAISNATNSIASRVTTLETNFSTLSTTTGATIEYVNTAISNATGSMATSIQTLTTNYNNLATSVATKATLSEVNTAVSNATNSIASRVTTLETSFTNLSSGTGATVEYVNSAISNATGSIATDVTKLKTDYATLDGTVATKATMSEVNTAISNATNSIASRVTTLETSFTNLSTGTGATVSYVDTAISDATGSLASAIDTLTATVNGNSAAITAESTARATATGDLFAQYTVKTDVAGLISGFGLASEAKVNEAPTSAFGIRADKFWIAPPAHASATAPTTGLYEGYTWLDTSVTPNVTKYRQGNTWSTTPGTLPFVVTTSSSTINGVTVPAGVFMNTAMIADATITSAKIGTLTADKIDTRGLTIKDAAGNVVLSAGAFAIPDTVTNVPAGWLNSNLTASIEAAQLTATNAANSISGKLDKAGSQILTGPVQLNAANAIYVGTADNGLYLGSTGIVGRKNGANTFAVAADGTATFSGNIAGASLDIGSSPAISGTKMTGSGAHIATDGKFALGTASKSIVYNGDDFYLNGRMVNFSNFSVSTPISSSTSINVAGPLSTGVIQSRSLAMNYSSFTRSSHQNDTLVGYAILPWTGWSSLTVNYSYVTVPPFNSSTQGTLVPNNVQVNGNWDNQTSDFIIGTGAGIGCYNATFSMVADVYTSLSDATARNGNFLVYTVAPHIKRPIHPSVSSAPFAYLNDHVITATEALNNTTVSGQTTLLSETNWANFFGYDLTSDTVNNTADGIPLRLGLGSVGTNVLYYLPTDSATNFWGVGTGGYASGSSNKYAINFRMMVAVWASSAYVYKDTAYSTYQSYTGSLESVNVSLTAI